jgi:hypothetical protein
VQIDLSNEQSMQIDLSSEHPENASASIRSSLAGDSNATAASDWHPLKQDLQRVSIRHPIVTSEANPKYRIT